MTFNKAREEKIWRAKKKAEEDLLRKLGVSEAVIEELRDFDRAQFNSDRSFYIHIAKIDESDSNINLFCVVSSKANYIDSFNQLLDDISNPKIYSILEKADKVSQDVLLMRINGIGYNEISQKLGISENAAKKRFSAIKKKIKKIF